ncbi:MAG TPA: transglycosylase family protein [Acidimicrobiia bacterium]|nr:transglycosylase family protein [Acidimicrobiia bacterium]
MRRPGHLRVDVGRSIGVAEHHFRTGLTRRYVTRIAAVACAGALVFVPAGAAHATTPSDSIASTTRAIEQAAQRWFSAQSNAARIDAGIADVRHQIALADASMVQTRKIATARAVIMYKTADVGIASMFGTTALDSARRARLVDDANAGGDEAIAQLTAAVDDLNAQQRSLQSQRKQLDKVLSEVAGERQTLDHQLAVLRTFAARQQDGGVALAVSRDRRFAGTPRVITTSDLAPPTAPPDVAAPVAVTASSANDGRVSPHHDDPFLVCTRDRESGGEYGAVSPSGYYGAYQFLPSTWDTVAAREGRLDLVGVLPSRASAYDQDETAWALYQWQGKGPWGGRC